MSYSPREAIQDNDRRGEFLRALAERFPDAYQSDGLWWSRSVPIEECEFELEDLRSRGSTFPWFCFRPYVELVGGRVYRDEFGARPVELILKALKKTEPEMFAVLTRLIREYK